MPYVIVTSAALADLARFRAFLGYKNPRAARKAAETIISAIYGLSEFPARGRPVRGAADDLRELVIDFGEYGYLARYRIVGDEVHILALRHGREAGY